DAVGDHDEIAVHDDVPAAAITPDDAADASSSVSLHGDDADLVADVDAGLDGCVYQQPVENGPSRCVERVDAVGGLDRDDQLLAGVAERRAPDRRCAGVDDGVEEPP